ncbi:hypothetical protein WMF28_12760 [Sorangium sp. So ce590]
MPTLRGRDGTDQGEGVSADGRISHVIAVVTLLRALAAAISAPR